MVKKLPAKQEMQVQSLDWEDPLEKEMATHSSIFARKIPWTEEPGRLQPGKESDTTKLLSMHHSFSLVLNKLPSFFLTTAEESAALFSFMGQLGYF